LSRWPSARRRMKRLGHRGNRQRGHDPHLAIALCLHHAPQHQAVHDRAEQPDRVGLGAIDPPLLGEGTPEEVPPAHDHGHLDPRRCGAQHFRGHVLKSARIQTDRLRPGQRPTTQFDDDPLIPGGHSRLGRSDGRMLSVAVRRARTSAKVSSWDGYYSHSTPSATSAACHTFRASPTRSWLWSSVLLSRHYREAAWNAWAGGDRFSFVDQSSRVRTSARPPQDCPYGTRAAASCGPAETPGPRPKRSSDEVAGGDPPPRAEEEPEQDLLV